jgi:plasmid stability protein
MTLTIELPDKDTLALRDRAAAAGLTLEQYASIILERDVAPEWLRESWENARRHGLDAISMDDIDSEIAASRRERLTSGS